MSIFSKENLRTSQILLLALVVLSVFAASQAVASVKLPFDKGEIIADGWQVLKINKHAEFVRIELVNSGEKTGLEIAANKDGNPSEWATKQYRLQPAPEKFPPEGLLLATMEILKKHEVSNSDPFVSSAEDKKSPPPQKHIETTPEFSYQIRYWLGTPYLSMFLALFFVLVIVRRSRLVVYSEPDTCLMPALIVSLFCGAVSFALFYHLGDDAPIHHPVSDTLLKIRHYAEGDFHLLTGNVSSYSLHHGVLWLKALGEFNRLGFGFGGLSFLAAALHSLAVIILTLYLALKRGPFFAFLAGILFALISLGQSACPYIANTRFIALPLVLFYVLMDSIFNKPGFKKLMLAGVLLGLMTDTHIVMLLLLPLYFFCAGLWHENRLRNFIFSVLAFYGSFFAASFETHILDLEPLWNSGLFWPFVIVPPVSAILGAFSSWRLQAYSDDDRRLLWWSLSAVYISFSIHSLSLIGENYLHPRFFIAAGPAYALVLATLLFKVYRTLSQNGGMAKKSFAALLICGLLFCYAGFLYDKDWAHLQAKSKQGWSVRDVEALAEKFQHEGFEFDDLLNRLETPNRTHFINALYFFYSDRTTEPRKKPALLVFKKRNDLIAEKLPPGFERVALSRDYSALIRKLDSWIVRERSEMCFEELGKESKRLKCVNRKSINNCLLHEDCSYLADISDYHEPLSINSMYQTYASEKAASRRQVKVSLHFPLKAGRQAESRTFMISGDNYSMVEGLSWKIDSVEGLQYKIDKDGLSVVVVAGGTKNEGSLTISGIIDPSKNIAQYQLHPNVIECRQDLEEDTKAMLKGIGY